MNKKKYLVFAIIALILIVAVIIGIGYSRRTVFKRVISKALNQYSWADNARASDDSYLKIDTNPENDDPESISYDSRTEQDSLKAIRYVNKELGFSEAVYQKMLSTTALMGRQSAENEKYIITWTYHPQKGLEVMYEKK